MTSPASSTLRAVLTEVGILELSAKRLTATRRSSSTFRARPQPAEVVPQTAPDSGPSAPLLPGQRDQIEDIVRRTYGKPRKDVDPREIKWIRKSLETALDGGRDEWPAPTCRAVWDLLKVGARRRRRSEKHEATFFHLTGFCLRPGFGDQFDEWRASELWKLYESGVHFQKDRDMERLVDYVASRRRWSDTAGSIKYLRPLSLGLSRLEICVIEKN